MYWIWNFGAAFMPIASFRQPSYRFQKSRNCAVVTIDGKDRYLGPYDSPESHEKYARLIAEWRESQRQAKGSVSPRTDPALSINDMLLAYWKFAKTYYVRDGEPTKELTSMQEAIRPLRKLYGRTEARQFGPKALKAVRQDLIDGDLSRKVTNHRINRIKRIFKWAVAEELVPPASLHGLQAVTGLRFGRTEARETDPVKPVADEWVTPILPYVAPQVATMIQLQRLTGMRPCEVVLMRESDIDRSGPVWVYEPHHHKNRWRGHRRLIPLGPKAQAMLAAFSKRPSAAYIFSAKEAEDARNANRKQNRKTPMTPSQAKRKPKAKPKRAKKDRYTVDSYRRAIEYGIKAANKDRKEDAQIGHWYPLQLRHTRATEVRRLFGLEAAQVSLGHARADVTEVYAEKNLELATKIAAETG
jgi:integrase